MSAQSPFELVDRNWGAVLDQAVTADHSELHIICPFIKHTTAKRLLRVGRPQAIQVLTRFSLADFCDGVSDLAALRLLHENGAQIKGIRNLHAKLYLFGNSRAIVTSANLTEAALKRNHEFGFVAMDQTIVQRCRDYFDDLWPRAGNSLDAVQLASWELQIEKARTQGAGPLTRGGLKDQGADVGFESLPSSSAPFTALTGRAFVKLFGEGDNRFERDSTIFDAIDDSGSHWACSYPKNKRPRQVEDGDVMFLAALVPHPNDSLIYGRAIGMAHQPGRDDATKADIQRRDWKSRWPHYVRVHSGEFIAGTLTNGISLSRLMDELGSEAFASTQDNAAAGVGNTDPRQSLKQQAQVRLSAQGYAWLQREFEAALSRHGRIPDAELATLDWPLPPSSSNSY
jgi:hypothetical protein